MTILLFYDFCNQIKPSFFNCWFRAVDPWFGVLDKNHSSHKLMTISIDSYFILNVSFLRQDSLYFFYIASNVKILTNKLFIFCIS